MEHRSQAQASPRVAQQQQGQQFVPVRRSGIFLHGLAKRHVLSLGLRRQASRVSGHEGKRVLGVSPVLGQVEMNSPDQIPGWDFNPFKKDCRSVPEAVRAVAKAAPSSAHNARMTSAVRYSAPGIMGAVSSSVASSLSVGAGKEVLDEGAIRGRHSAPT